MRDNRGVVEGSMDRIYVQTNDADRNEIVAFDRDPDGAIEPIGRLDTGGQGTGVALNGDGSLTPVGDAEGLPETVAGLAAS
jgi:hypothetical protein